MFYLRRFFLFMTMMSLSFSQLLKSSDIVIGVPNWPSAHVTAHLLKYLIEENFGLDVELQNASNTVIFEGINSGSMHIHPETWAPLHLNLINRYVNEKKTVIMSKKQVVAEQGICVTRKTQERTGIVNLSDLADPEMAEKFDRDGNGKGDIWIGGPGWAVTTEGKIRAKTYAYDETMDLRVMEESLAYVEVDAAEKKKKNIVFYCYSPHYMFSLYELIYLKEDPYDPSKWKVLQPGEDPNWLEKSHISTASETPTFSISYAARLQEADPLLARFLSRVQLSNELVTQMTYAIVIEKQNPKKFVSKWAEENTRLVDDWLM
jgi:glycine betaine/proline transport system substrate-binding protein